MDGRQRYETDEDGSVFWASNGLVIASCGMRCDTMAARHNILLLLMAYTSECLLCSLSQVGK